MADDTKNIVRLLLHEKPIKIVLAMAKTEDAYPSQLAKDADCTFPHTLAIIKTLEENGINLHLHPRSLDQHRCESEKIGRKKEVKLTSRGVDIAHDLAGLVRHLQSEVDKRETEGEAQDETPKEEGN